MQNKISLAKLSQFLFPYLSLFLILLIKLTKISTETFPEYNQKGTERSFIMRLLVVGLLDLVTQRNPQIL
jgi:hypothetical protein